MRTLKARYIDSDKFKAFSANLKRVRGDHRKVLIESGFKEDLEAISDWGEQLRSGSQEALEDLAKTGQKKLISLKEKARALLNEQQLAEAEFPKPSSRGEAALDDFSLALRDITQLVDSFLEFIQPPITEIVKGDRVMELLKPKNDDRTTEVGIKESRRLEVAQALGGFLASTYSLYVKSLFYHWNVTGPQFHSLHELFEEHYEDLHTAGDKIAERIRALGHYTPGTLKAFAELSIIEDDADLPTSADDMLSNLQQAHELCAAQARSVMKTAVEADDEVTADMMIGRMEVHDQAIWMLSASKA